MKKIEKCFRCQQDLDTHETFRCDECFKELKARMDKESKKDDAWMKYLD